MSREQITRLALARDRSRSHEARIDPRTVDDGGTLGQVLAVAVADVEPLLDRTILYLLVEGSNPPRHVTALVDLAATYLTGVRGTATFRRRAGSTSCVWEFVAGATRSPEKTGQQTFGFC